MENKKYFDGNSAEKLMHKVKGSIGSLAALDTDNKSSVVAAINELCNAIFDTEPNFNVWLSSIDNNNNSFSAGKIVELSDGTLVASTRDTNNYKDIKYSEDNGKTWQDTNITKNQHVIYSIYKSSNDTCVASNTWNEPIKYSEDKGKTWLDTEITSPSELYRLTNSTIFACKSQDYGIKFTHDGKTWQNSNVTRGNFIIHELANGKILALGSSIKYSNDGGETWQDSNILDSYITDISHYSIYELSNNNIVICIKNKGIKYSNDGGETWQDTNITSNSYGIKLYKLSNGTLLISYDSTGIKYSEDNGETWQDSNVINGTWSIYECPNGYIYCTSSGGGIKYSEDSGKTWQSSNLINSTYADIIYLHDNIVIARDTINYAIVYSTNNGKTWYSTSAGYNYKKIYKLPNGNAIALEYYGIYYSSNGEIWNNISSKRQMTYLGQMSNGMLFITGNGFIYSEDDGETWQDTNITSESYNIEELSNNKVLLSGPNLKYCAVTKKPKWETSNNSIEEGN